MPPSSAAAARAATYYNYLTGWYTRYASGTYGWHYGIWDPGIVTFDAALRRSNERLVEDVALTPESHVLDVGCGVGGFAVWVAETFGCNVTAVNIAPLQLIVARQLAIQHQVSDRCAFRVMDMAELLFAEDTFDLVVNQESFCHAFDKGAYLSEVHRVLKPGGSWRAIDFGLANASLSHRELDWYRTVCDGFAIPSFLPASAGRTLLRQSGFTDLCIDDLTRQVSPTARLIVRGSLLPVLLARMGLDWLRFPGNRARRSQCRGHFEAGLAYSRGLLRGCFHHYLYRAHKSSRGVEG
jgi:ubiquinone/menaquinone biosynthesis C-methylase UbiE